MIDLLQAAAMIVGIIWIFEIYCEWDDNDWWP